MFWLAPSQRLMPTFAPCDVATCRSWPLTVNQSRCQMRGKAWCYVTEVHFQERALQRGISAQGYWLKLCRNDASKLKFLNVVSAWAWATNRNIKINKRMISSVWSGPHRKRRNISCWCVRSGGLAKRDRQITARRKNTHRQWKRKKKK